MRFVCRAPFLQLVDICRTQLDAWSEAGVAVDLPTQGKALSFEFSTQLLVRPNDSTLTLA